MSVKHIEYLKVRDSKLLVVEVRPVKCLLDTPSGPTYTDKWMEPSHWKELHHLLMNIVDEYEEQKATQEVKCNQPKCKTGEIIQMGYMFRNLPSCWCSLYFLTPRSSCTWTEKDDDDSGKLQDKGGRFEDLVACGEMLVISVILRDPAESSTESVLRLNSSTTHHQACLNKKLIKALDSRMEYTISVSDYFNASSASSEDSSSKSVSSSSRGKKKNSPVMVKAFRADSSKEEHKKKENYRSTVDQDSDSNHCDASVNPSNHLDLTLADPNPRGERSEKNDINCGYDSVQLIDKSQAKKVQLSKKNLKTFKNLKHCTQLTLNKEHCRDVLVSETELRHFYLFGMKNDKDKEEVNVHENVKKTAEAVEAEGDNRIMEEFKEIPSKNLSVLSYETNENEDSFIEVKEEVYSDPESHNYECRSPHDSSFSNSFSQDTCVIQRCDRELENVKFERQTLNSLAPSPACGSGEQKRPQNVLHNANLSERLQQENVGENAGDSAGDIFPETLSHSSFVTIPSQDHAKTAHLRMTGEDDEVPWFSECVDRTEIKMEAGEGRSPHKTNGEYSQQGYITKKKKIKLRRHSSSSEYIPANVKYPSGAVDKTIFYESFTEDAGESLHSAHLSEDLQSSMEEGDYGPEEVQLQKKPTQGSVMISYQKECVNNILQKDSHLFLTSEEEHVPQKIHTKTKIPQESLSPKSLMLQVNNHDMSSHVKIESYSAGGYPTSSQNCANIQSNELNERSLQDTNCDVHSGCKKRPEEIHPSRKALKSSKCFQQMTQLTSDKEHCEEIMEPDTQCQNSQLGLKHGNGKKKVTTHRDLTKNSETSPELEYIPIGIEYLSGAKESLFSAKNSVIGNEAIHHTQVFKNLSLVVEKRKHTPERKQLQVQLTEASDLSLCKGDVLEILNESVEKNVPQRMQGKAKEPKECLSTERFLLHETSSAEFSNVNIDSRSTDECPRTPQNCAEVYFPASAEESSQQSTIYTTEEAPLFISNQESVEEKETLVETLRSMKFLNRPAHKSILKNSQGKDARRLDSENKSCERKKESYNAEEKKKLKEKSDKSKVKSYVNEIKESRETPSSVFCASHEENSEAEDNSDFSRDRVKHPSFKGWYIDNSSAHHSITVSSSSPEVCDADYDLQLENHSYEPQTNSFAPHPAYAFSEQRNAHSDPLDSSLYDEEKEDSIVNTENDLRSNISSTHNCIQSVQEKRSWKDDTAADLSGYVDEPERRMEDHASPIRTEDYVPKRVTPKGIKKLKRRLPDPDYVPTSKVLLHQAKKGLFLPQNSMTLVEESDHFTQDLERNFAETSQKYDTPRRRKSSSMSEESISPETDQSEEGEKIMNLRRSKRIKTKVINFSEFWNTSCETCDESLGEWCAREKPISEKIEKPKGYSHKYAEKKSVLKQTKIMNYIKPCSTPKKQLKSPDKVKSDLTDENEKQEGYGKEHILKKKKGIVKYLHKATAKEIASKPSGSKSSKPFSSKHSKASSSKHELSNKAQVSKKNATLNYYNEIWNFTLPEQMNKKGKNNSNTTKQKGKKSTSKTRKNTLEDPNKGKNKKKRALKSSSKSDSENCSPNAIDDDFYWFIQAETEKLCAITSDSDDAVGSRTSSDSNPEKSSKSRGKEKQPQEKRNSQEECFILNEVPESTHTLDALRTSYKQLQNMTKSDLEQRLDENIPYLEQVIRGDVPNERHQLYKESSRELRLQQDYLIYGPFTSDQSLYVLDLLKKKLSHMEKLIGDVYDLLTYRCRVLVPTFFMKIVMDNENVSMKEACRLMAKFTLNKDIADDIQSIESRRF